MKLTKILSFILCILLVCTLVFSACNSNNNNSDKSSSDEVSAITTTEQSASAYEIVTSAASTGEETVPTTKKETKAKETTPPAQDKVDSNAGPVDSQEPEPMTCTITVSDRDYTFKSGDRFTYTCYLKTPDKIEDIQAQVNYTGRCLKLISTEAEDILPLIGDYAVCNTDNPGIVKYNATRYKGINFKEEATLVTLEFEVIFGGYASVSNAIEIMTGTDGTAYAETYKFAEGVKTRETIG